MGLVDYSTKYGNKNKNNNNNNSSHVSNDLRVVQAYYGTSHARTGVLVQLSCMSIKAIKAIKGCGKDKGDETQDKDKDTGADADADIGFCGCLQFTDPLIPPSLARDITRRYVGFKVELSFYPSILVLSCFLLSGALDS